MPKMKYDLSHSVSDAKKLNISIPGTVKKRELRVDSAGDSLASAMYSNNGYYAKLSAAFDSIEKKCNKALNSKHVATTKVKSELKDAKSKANSQKGGCANRKKELKDYYTTSIDIANDMD